MSLAPAPLYGIGHNRGPAAGGAASVGAGFCADCRRRTRADLLPVLPVEVVRGAVRRAKALGLPYRTYAGIRASTGRDLITFLPGETYFAKAMMHHG